MENIVIEGDNIDFLNNAMENNNVNYDVIIMDPPYNTNIDYIGYKDSDFKEGWIEFIKIRLTKCYSLLSNLGVIFIHIDENELIQLTKLCYDIFDVNNVNILIWKKTNELFDKNRVEKPTHNVRNINEFVLICYKNKAKTIFNPMFQPIFQDNNLTEIQKPMETILDFLGTTSSAKDELYELLGNRDLFSTPKPMKLFKEFIRVASIKKSNILDIFAGSGTTAHAVMDLNKEDGGNRKFVLITNNENNICRDVTIPRINKAIEVNNYRESYVFKTL